MNDISVLVYAEILLCGTAALVASSRLEPLREWSRALFAAPWFSIPTVVTWTLLLWPKAVSDAFAAGEEVGVLRLVRVSAFVAIFGVASRHLFVAWHRKPGALISCYLGYVAVCAASAAWSTSAVETAWKAFELLVAVTTAGIWLVQGREHGGRQLIHALLYVIFAVVLFSCVGVLLHPDIAYAIHSGEAELATASAAGIVPRVNPNNLGQLSGTVFATGVLLLLEAPRGRRFGAALITCVGLVTLVAAHSRTSLLAAASILCVLMLVRRHFAVALIAMPVTAIAALLAGSRVAEFFARGQDVDALASMTGRMFMWAIAWESFLQTPWLGKGFYAGHKSLSMQGIVENYSSVDNTYLESLVNVGMIGTAFLVAFAVRIGVAAFSMARSPMEGPDRWAAWERATAFVLMGFVLVRSLTGPTFQALHVNVTIALVCAVVLTLWREDAQRTSPQPAIVRESSPPPAAFEHAEQE